MGRDSRYHMRIVQDRKEVTRLHLLGYTQQAIAEKLGKDQGNISRTLKRIRNELDKDAVNNMGEVRAVQNARLEGILKEYWEMYSSGVMDKPEAAVAGALKTVSEISKLLGVNINPAQVIDQKITTETVDPASIAAKLASVFSDDNIVDGEVVEPQALEHDTGDAEGADDGIADDHDTGDTGDADDDTLDDAEDADDDTDTELQELPDELDETILDADIEEHDAGPEQHEASPQPTRTGPNPGPVISGRRQPTSNRGPITPGRLQPTSKRVAAEALAEQLAQRFSS